MSIIENTTTTSGVIEHIDPNTLVIEANVRPSAALTVEFIQSIKASGVLTPVLARRDEHGNVLVRAGQRRTLGAREAGVATIPVYVIDADETTTDRIVQQMIENDQRQALTTADRTAAFQQLAFEGMTITSIARRTGTKAAEVKRSIKVAENPAAAAAIAEHDLTLDQAAVLTEFDDERTRTELIQVATLMPSQFEHATQRARDAQAQQRARQAVEADLTARGFQLVDHDDPEHAAYVLLYRIRTTEGDRVEPEQIEALDGRGAAVDMIWNGEPRVSYYLRDPEAHGFQAPAVVEQPVTGGPMTDEQKAERRTLIANNKAWASAEVVRREWLAALVNRKQLPKGAAQVITSGLTIHRQSVGTAVRDGSALAHTFLRVERASYGEPDRLAALVDATPTKAQHVALAVVLGGIEEAITRQTWRTPSRTAAIYFQQLATWGYGLSEVEQIVTGHQTLVSDSAE
ncbi:ParB N-terminal domain-containing protein [Clavibacter michiganensis]|uniref:ParB/RepB/Spo0J family partition protein n=1 Tax=Clavibacter michiganensis TaxID=28447 RepID=UPI0026DAC46A|nr:ParB N-terminal domain-containing protein [Clavibacter michiganensis]MDO4070330.1 ParB N-terminal domain-containing protein [Clavibacter michiganensis]